MVFSAEAYERAFPRKQSEPVKTPASVPFKPGDVLEDVKKVEEPAKDTTPAPDPGVPDQGDPGGGVGDGD